MTRDFGDDVFAGAAKYYSKYRPSYPIELFEAIAQTFSLNGLGKLLDLGCGTGEVAIPLAKYFKSVLALDPDPEMLAEGQKKAQKLEIGNISWQKGSSKELNRLKGSFRLATMGQSFHWMDQETVLDELYKVIEPGGGVAIIGTEPLQQGSVAAQKDEIIQKLIKTYLGPERRAGDKIYSHPPKRYEDMLPNSKFKNFQAHNYDIELSRNINQILGILFSMSWANKRLFGDKIGAFESQLKRELKAISPTGKFQEKKRFRLYTVGK